MGWETAESNESAHRPGSHADRLVLPPAAGLERKVSNSEGMEVVLGMDFQAWQPHHCAQALPAPNQNRTLGTDAQAAPGESSYGGRCATLTRGKRLVRPLLHLERPQQPSVCFSESIAFFKRVPPFKKAPLGCEERPGLGWILAQKSV